MTINNNFAKDPSSVLDFKWDWRAKTNGTTGDEEVNDWLSSGETIVSHTITTKNFILSSGSTIQPANDSGSNNLDAVYYNTTLGGDIDRARFNGTNSFVDYYSQGLVDNYAGDETTIIVRAKVNSPTVWTDGKLHGLFAMQPKDPILMSGTGNIFIYKDITNNTIMFYFVLPSGAFLFHSVSFSSILWFSAGMTFSQVGNEMRAYLNGIQAGITETPLTAWNGSYPVPNSSYLGTTTPNGLNQWLGWIADGILGWGVAASPAQMLSIHTKLDAETLTTTDLDTVFGIGNYAWWKLNEPPELIIDSSSLTDSATSVTVWLSGGEIYTKYIVSCLITTSDGRTDERSIVIDVMDR